MTKLIGVLGFKGSGKDTLGSIIQKHYGFRKDSFAGPLKDMVSIIFSWPRNLLEGDTDESRFWREQPDIWWEEKLDWDNHPGKRISPRLTPRAVLQFFGTDVVRQGFHDDIWLLSLQSRIRSYEKPTIVTDCRFPNEVNSIRENGGLILRVRRGKDPDWFETAKLANTSPVHSVREAAKQEMYDKGIHISEWAWIGMPIDHLLENSSDIDSLEQKTICLNLI